MKVKKVGTFVWTEGGMSYLGWTVDAQGSSLPNAEAQKRARETVLHYIAGRLGFKLVPVDEVSSDLDTTNVPLEVEREAADMIAMVRWSEKQ